MAPDFDRTADAYRRRIRCRTLGAGVVAADLEDDFHRFGVTLHHDGTTVLAVEATAGRWPWATCPGAADPLRALAGMPLSERFTAAAAWTEPRRNCTHQFDAACLAVTHAVRGTPERTYDAEVPSRWGTADGAARVRLWVDGELRLTWDLTWAGLLDPTPPFDAAPWRGGFMRWADATLPPEDAEAAIVLRRASDIGMGRGMDLDAVPEATQLPASMQAVCHTMQPDVIAGAARNRGTIRDFAAHPERLLAD